MAQIKPIGLFHTPKDWEELMKWIHLHAPGDRAHLTTAAAMAWNLASVVADDQYKEKDNA